MYNRVDYTDRRSGKRVTTHIVGNTMADVTERILSLTGASKDDVVVHSIVPEQPDFMTHELDALSDAISKDGNSPDVMMLHMMSELSRDIKKMSSVQSEILEELRFLTARISEQSTD